MITFALTGWEQSCDSGVPSGGLDWLRLYSEENHHSVLCFERTGKDVHCMNKDWDML